MKRKCFTILHDAFASQSYLFIHCIQLLYVITYVSSSLSSNPSSIMCMILDTISQARLRRVIAIGGIRKTILYFVKTICQGPTDTLCSLDLEAFSRVMVMGMFSSHTPYSVLCSIITHFKRRRTHFGHSPSTA